MSETPVCLNVKEVAKMLCISVSSVHQINKAELPSINILKRRRVWLQDDVIAYINKKAGRTIAKATANEWDAVCRN